MPDRRPKVEVARLARGERPCDVACAMGVRIRTVYKWRKRYRNEGLAGLQDRASWPVHSPLRTCASVEAEVIRLRRERRSMDLIAQEIGASRATARCILARHGRNRWRDLDPAEPVKRYERGTPATRSRANRVVRSGSLCISVLMTIRASPSARFWPSKARRMRWRSCAPSPSASGISAPSPTPPRPMARPNGSSSLLRANGPMGAHIRPQSNERRNCLIGCITTIGIDHMPEKIENHPSANQGWT